MRVVTFKLNSTGSMYLDLIAINFFDGIKSVAIRYAIKHYLKKRPSKKELYDAYRFLTARSKHEERVITFKIEEDDFEYIESKIEAYNLGNRSDAIKLALYRMIVDKIINNNDETVPPARMIKIKLR